MLWPHVMKASLRSLPLTLPCRAADIQSAWRLYVIQLKDGAPVHRAELFAALRNDDIGVNVHYSPVHLQPYYRQFGFKSGDFPAAEAYYERALTIPLFAGMSDSQQDYVIARLRHYCGRK